MKCYRFLAWLFLEDVVPLTGYESTVQQDKLIEMKYEQLWILIWVLDNSHVMLVLISLG